MIRGNAQFEERENEVIRRCQRGEREPFAYLVNQYKDWLFGHVYPWVGDREIAEEMSQEIFIKAFKEIKSFRGEAKFSTWLFQVARNRCRDFWRSRDRHRGNLKPIEELESKLALSPQAEVELIREQEGARLRQSLKKLPEIYREALTYRYLNEMTFEEMSQLLGEGKSSLKMRVVRGMDLLRKKLKESM